MLSFWRVLFLVKFFMLFFITGVFFCYPIYVFFSKIILFVLGFFSTFWYFALLCSDLEVVFKKKLSSSKLVLIQFGYRGFSFLSHAVRLWFVVFSKFAFVSLEYCVILFQTG